MEGLDVLLSKAIFQSVRDEFDAERIQSINKMLKQEHGITFEKLFNSYDKMRNTLYQFEEDLKDIEDKVLRNFLTIEKTANDTWIIIRDKHLAERILKTFADVDKKTILDCIRDRSETVPRILSLCNLPNTSGYRKINQIGRAHV